MQEGKKSVQDGSRTATDSSKLSFVPASAFDRNVYVLRTAPSCSCSLNKVYCTVQSFNGVLSCCTQASQRTCDAGSGRGGMVSGIREWGCVVGARGEGEGSTLEVGT